MLTDIAKFVQALGLVVGSLETYGYLLLGDPRWLSAGVVTLLVAGLATLFLRLWRGPAEGGEIPAPQADDDVYWTDAAAASEAAIAELSFEEMAARFAELDESPSARVGGYRAQSRDRLCLGMSSDQRSAWVEIVSNLDMEPAGPRCTCGVMRGVITPSRSCAFHGS